jgi:glycerol-3-phosphate O-acyltransferase
VLHVFALPGLLACCLRRQPRSSAEIQQLAALAYPFLQREFYLPDPIDELPTAVTDCLQVLQQHGFIEQTSEGWQAGSGHLYSLADSISPILERYYLSTVVLIQAGSGQLEQSQFEQRSQQLAERMALLLGLRTPDYYDRGLFNTYLKALQDTGLSHTDSNGKLGFSTTLVQTYRPLWQLLNPTIRHSIAALSGGEDPCH